MIDVYLVQGPDGLEIEVQSGLVKLTGGIESALVLSLAGGNEEDAVREDTIHKQFWANFDETTEAPRLRSETAHLLRSLPLSSGNLELIEAAASRDLAWMLDEDIVSEMAISARIISAKRVQVQIDTEQGTLKVTMPWWG